MPPGLRSTFGRVYRNIRVCSQRHYLALPASSASSKAAHCAHDMGGASISSPIGSFCATTVPNVSEKCDKGSGDSLGEAAKGSTGVTRALGSAMGNGGVLGTGGVLGAGEVLVLVRGVLGEGELLGLCKVVRAKDVSGATALFAFRRSNSCSSSIYSLAIDSTLHQSTTGARGAVGLGCGAWSEIDAEQQIVGGGLSLAESARQTGEAEDVWESSAGRGSKPSMLTREVDEGRGRSSKRIGGTVCS
ncbi:hypothetical protein FA95DRAFT_1188777 [Auriscalpium vulgare]|uniref:Uncharacterized protein n=1 Tax=Auriscalpium vulgare TaxID=40419 RepID=A0ACB8R4W1_9AGAM|nr:hypothetical protein FA95DRAFT_1188777 [Auriscalpium vulgare]